MVIRKILTCFVCITIISGVWCCGQTNRHSDNEYIWVNLGLGGSLMVGGLSGGINVSYQSGNHLFSMRGVSNQEIAFGGTPEYNYDIGLLYGLSAKKKYILASISAGLSFVGYNTITNFERQEYTIGVPIEIQLFLTAKVIGIGIYGFANLNFNSSFMGFLICLQIGKLR